MKGPFRFVLALGTVILLASGAALADCPLAITFGSTNTGCLGSGSFPNWCLVETPNASALATLQGDYWAVGAGDVATMAGNDNGSCGATACGGVGEWLLDAGGSFAAVLGNWAVPGFVDGCIDALPDPKSMAFLFSDTSADGTTGYFAATTSATRQSTGTEYPLRNLAGPANVTLVPIPKPSITGSTRNGTDVTVDVAAPDLNAGFYPSDGAAVIGDVIAGYKIYSWRVDRGNPAPADRTRSNWTAASGVIALGSPGTTNLITCGVDSDVFLATAVVGDGGFETAFVSENSNLIQCGTTLATPEDLPRLDRRSLPTRPQRKPRLR